MIRASITRVWGGPAGLLQRRDFDQKHATVDPDIHHACGVTCRKVAEYSGGWQMRMCLGKILLQSPDVLLLDEPTNHLDLDAIEWLEGYVSALDIPTVIVSHDREFLDQVRLPSQVPPLRSSLSKCAAPREFSEGLEGYVMTSRPSLAPTTVHPSTRRASAPTTVHSWTRRASAPRCRRSTADDDDELCWCV